MTELTRVSRPKESDKTISSKRFEDIIGRLKAYEERTLDEENRDETKGKLMFASSGQNSSTSRGRRRGRGGRENIGRGRGRDNSQESTNQIDLDQAKEKKDMSRVICFRCDKPGQFVSKCPDLPQN